MDAPAVVTLRREPGPFTRSLTALVLRVALGMSLLLFGMGKLKAKNLPADDPKHYPEMITKGMPEKIAFPGDVKLFAEVLPYAEVGLGAALLGGLLTTLGGFLTGVLLLVLLFGHLHANRIEKVPEMLTYLLTDAAILWLSPITSNYISLDGILFGWFWAPRREGEFRRTP
jgi:uncharacterized membrane protein YphA (DoxX/SURF4 family)